MSVMPDEERIARELYRYDRMAQDTLATLDDIDEDAIRRYREMGYLVVEQAFSDENIRNAIDAVMDIIHGKVEGPYVQFTRPSRELATLEERELACRKVMDYMDYEPRLRLMSLHPPLLSVLEKICGEPVRIIQNTGLLKPPHGGGEKPWHQDMAYGPLAYDKPAVGIWIALDEAGLDNGCMHIIPRSHTNGATPHYAIRDWQICDANVPVEQDVAVPLKPGGVLIFHGMLYHGTPVNRSPKRRRALQNHYVGQSAVKLTPREYKRWFTQEMTGAEC